MMKNKIVWLAAAVIVVIGFVLGMTGVVDPVHRSEKEEKGIEFVASVGVLIVRSDATEIPTDENGYLYAKQYEKLDENGNTYYDYDFEYEKTYGLFQFLVGDCCYSHVDPSFYDSHLSVEYTNDTGRRFFGEGKLCVKRDDSIIYWMYTVYQKESGEVFADLSERTTMLTYDMQIKTESSTEWKEDNVVIKSFSGGGAVYLEDSEKPKEIVIYEYDASGNKAKETRYEAEKVPDQYKMQKDSAFAIVENVYSDHAEHEIVTPSENMDTSSTLVFNTVKDDVFTFKSLTFLWK